VLTVVVLLFLMMAFGSLVVQLQRMLFGRAAASVPRGERPSLPLALLAVPVVLLAVIGVTLPEPMRMLLTRAAGLVRP
jgi:hypothetical protein